MKRTHPAFWGAGWAGLAVGALMSLMGVLDANESARLAGGYGLMLMGSAVYLLGGLGLRQALVNRAARSEDRRCVGRWRPGHGEPGLS